MDTNEQRLMWILRQAGLTAPQLKRQYVAYKDQRGLFEDGYGTIVDVTALITPAISAMLDLEDQMLAESSASQQVTDKTGIYYPSGKLKLILAFAALLFFVAVIVMAVA